MSEAVQSKRKKRRLPLPRTPRLVRRLVRRGTIHRGKPPGSLTPLEGAKAEPTRMEIMRYSPTSVNVQPVEAVASLQQLMAQPFVTWLNVTGLEDLDAMRDLGELFQIHPLALEDIVHTDQRPKLEEHEDAVFVVVRMLTFDKERAEVQGEQVAFYFGEDYVITFQERSGDVFDPVRERINAGRGQLRHRRADYLAYALVDVIVDNYFTILEAVGAEIEKIETEILTEPDERVVHKINHLKQEMLLLRRAVWPLREVLAELQRSTAGPIQSDSLPYFRDTYDHAVQVIDTIEVYRDLLGTMLDLYLSMVSHRMNEVMKVLTVIATIFIPLTFIAGIYGMNFEYMPELKWRWAYPAVWGVMLAVFIGMLFFFRRKKWI